MPEKLRTGLDFVRSWVRFLWDLDKMPSGRFSDRAQQTERTLTQDMLEDHGWMNYANLAPTSASVL